MKQEVSQLNIVSLRDLEYKLGFTRQLLHDIASVSGRYYKPFWKIGTKPRRIDHPTGILKEIQARIQFRLLCKISFPDHIHGGVAKRSPITNAGRHLRVPVIVTLDVRKCFPSVTNKQIFRVWRNVLNCSPTIAHLLTKLTTFEGHLPQGAPTSTALANLALAQCDEKILSFCHQHKIVYTRYIDDLVFSGPLARAVINDVVRTAKSLGFRLPHAKTKIMGPHTRHEVTGLVVSSKLNVAREKRAKLRAAINNLRSGNIPANAILSIKGKIGFVRQVNQEAAKSLEKQLECKSVNKHKR